MRRFLSVLGLGLLTIIVSGVVEAGPPVHTPRKYEFPATGHWGYVPTWRDQDPNELSALRRATLAQSLRNEAWFINYFGDYAFVRPDTAMQYTWDVPSYKRSVR